MPKAHSETYPAIRAGKFLFLHPPSYPYHSSLQEGEHSFPPLPLSLFLPPIERENGFSFLPLSPCVCGCFGWAAAFGFGERGRKRLNSPVEGCLLAHSIAAEESQNAYGKKPHRRSGGGESFSSLSLHLIGIPWSVRGGMLGLYPIISGKGGVAFSVSSLLRETHYFGGCR